MRKSDQPVLLTDAQFAEERTKLRENMRATASHVCRFLSDVLVYHANLRANKKFPLLLPVNLRSQQVKVIDEKPWLIVKVSWIYVNQQRSLPNVKGVDTLLDGIRIDTDASNNNSMNLALELKIDLGDWPHISRNLLHSYLSSKQGGGLTERDISILVEHFYPSTTLNVLHLAKDMGQVTRDKTAFKTWLEEISANKTTSGVTLPTSFDIS